MEKEQKLAYLAGFFDGEGCVTIGKNGSLCLGIVNTSLPVLEMMQEELGGTIAGRKQMVNKKQYVWRVYGHNAFRVALALHKYSVEKREQFEEIMDWYVERDAYPPAQNQGRGRKAHPERDAAIKMVQEKLTRMKMGVYAN